MQKKLKELNGKAKLNTDELQKYFLQKLKDLGIYDNIGLYKSNDDNLKSWSRIILNGTKENSIKSLIPCN